MLKDSQNDKYTYEYEDSDRVGLLDTQTYKHTLTHRQADRQTGWQAGRYAIVLKLSNSAIFNPFTSFSLSQIFLAHDTPHNTTHQTTQNTTPLTWARCQLDTHEELPNGH